MNFLLLYYTGTFHTRYLAKMIEKRLCEKGHQVKTYDITSQNPVDLSSYDAIGIGYPIYAFNSPQLMNRYLKSVHLPKEKRYFIYKQSGETFGLNDASSRIIKRILKRNKCVLENEYHFIMPYNIHFRYDDAFVKEILKYDQRLLDIFMYEFFHGIHRIINSNFLYNFTSALFSILRPGAHINGKFYRVDKAKCIQCNACIQMCPVNNITKKNDRIRFKNHCQMCMRCSFFCPKDAISIGLINGWKVNGAYHFDQIKSNSSIPDTYITDQKKGFYRCFIKTFNMIDSLYLSYFDRSSTD